MPGYEDEPYEKMEKQRFTVALPGDYQSEVCSPFQKKQIKTTAPAVAAPAAR